VIVNFLSTLFRKYFWQLQLQARYFSPELTNFQANYI